MLLSLAALGWGFYNFRRARQMAERLENSRSSHFRFVDQTRDALSGLEEEVRSLRVQLRAAQSGSPFVPEMTIAEATALDPRVESVLAGLHIGGCSSCAVSPEDTIAHAAAANGQEIDQVIRSLNALVSASGADVAQMLERRPNVQLSL